MPIAAQALANDPQWLKEFCHRLVAALPRGFNDQEGNYVQIRASQGEWENYQVRRVGAAVINPIVQRGYLLHIRAMWRLTEDRLVDFVKQVNFQTNTIIPGGRNEPG